MAVIIKGVQIDPTDFPALLPVPRNVAVILLPVFFSIPLILEFDQEAEEVNIVIVSNTFVSAILSMGVNIRLIISIVFLIGIFIFHFIKVLNSRAL